MADFKITDKSGIKLKTANKYVREDLAVTLTDADINNIVAENIKKDVSILGITGTYDNSITGVSYSNYTMNITGDSQVQSVDIDKGQDRLTVNFNGQSDYSINANDQCEVEVNANGGNVTAENLTAENIKEGVSILGKVGTFKGGSGENRLKKLLDTTKSAYYLFNSYIGTSIDDLIQYSDTENVEDMRSMFNFCSNLQTIPQLDSSNVIRTSYMLRSCTKLKTIPLLNMINVTNADEMFNNCSSLTNLTLLNIKVNLTIGSGTSYGHLLTLDSLINTIKELVKTSASRKLTMGIANLEKIANVYVKRTTTGDIPTCLRDNSNIDLAKAPCEVCESTDEGAMTLEDYANLKGWGLQ